MRFLEKACITVNDYLAERDADGWVQFTGFGSLRWYHLDNDLSVTSKQAAYKRDIFKQLWLALTT